MTEITEASLDRPTEDSAADAVSAFLESRGVYGAPFRLIEDGEDGWAFWITDDDTTSYVHQNLSIEWYGTSWDPTKEVIGE